MSRRILFIVVWLNGIAAFAHAAPADRDTDSGAQVQPPTKAVPIVEAATPATPPKTVPIVEAATPATPPKAVPTAIAKDTDSEKGAASTTSQGGSQSADTDEDNVSPAAVPKERMPVLKLQVKPTEVSVGQKITWQLTVKHKKEDAVHLEGGASFGGLEIKSKDRTETPAENGWVLETLSVSLVGFDPGDITIPKQKLTVVDYEGHLAEIMTPESFVTVKSLLANEPEPKLKEDTGPGEVVMEKDYLLLWILGIVIAIAAVAGLTLLGRKLWAMRKPKPAPPPPPPRPAEEIANEKLDALRRSNLLPEGHIKEFHVRLSEAIREYLGNRFHFDSLELSSEELIQAIRRIKLSQSEYRLILDFLGETDLVKFAKALPTLQESEDLLDHAFGFVERTTPKTVAPEDGQKATSEPKEADRA